MAHVIPPAGNAGRVLLADDEELVRATISLILKAQGYQVIEARDGQEAVEKYLREPDAYDVVLLDLDMPRLTGAEASQKITGLNSKAKIILLSGGVTPPPCGTSYLQKPFHNQELVRMVGEMAGQI